MAYGFTYTLPTITGSHSDFPVVLKTADFPATAIDGGSSSILNGGGNLRAYTSSAKTTQLAVHVVEFVAGGTPAADVRVKIPTAATGNTIYIEADAVETVQPAVTNTYGRNAVYSNDDRRYGLKDNSSTVVDYTGNDDGTLGGSGATTGTSPAFGSSNLEMNLTAYVGGLTDPFPGASHAAIRSWYKIPNEASKGVCGAWLGGDSNMSVLLFTGSNDLVFFRVNTGGTAATATSTSVVQNSAWHHVCGYWDGTTVRTMVDGALEGSASRTGTISTPSSAVFEIGRYNNNNWTIPDDMQEVSLSTNSNVTSDYIATEYANQSAATAWGTVGTWADSGGGSTIQIAQATETNTAFPITAQKSLAIGQAVETNTAFAVTALTAQNIPIGLASETGTAFSATWSKVLTIGLAAETDAAFSVTPVTANNVPIGLAVEADAAFAVSHIKALSTGLATETDTALPVTASIGQPIGLAQETDTAFTLSHSKALGIDLSIETDTALPFAFPQTINIGLAVETASAFPFAVYLGQGVIAAARASRRSYSSRPPAITHSRRW
ncbi:LamG-like jellyroll fold domain-containing protein [Sedimenticola selenatireducens]|uniref:LamG domain-containing protein n=1 Tax=Sedimenticola selenatireducens TaxID=191960 RepID=A0A557SCK9_9GAMM|nr:LamG-like jellyroll fold domain-containing protein [Sedimenticola selenatireducens]TVO75136.1 LamG domain-containing protein [Sedimenticola selenatireducens]TVT67009.1 MAG: LamG domain-containing protein [Sedimenticola selenatireducens]